MSMIMAISGNTNGEVDLMNRILVVDDDLDLCELLAKYLQREGFEFDMVHNGSQGWNAPLQAIMRSSFWMSCCRE
jgi:DNA-binding NtrC family response regulator